MNAASTLLEVTPRQALVALKASLGLSDDDLAASLGTSIRTLQRWRTGAAYPQQAARRRLALLIKLEARARAAFGDTANVRRWSHSASRLLGGLTPAEAIRAGRADRAEAALEAFDAGIFL